MKKPLMMVLAAAALVAAMLPGVASADTPTGYVTLWRNPDTGEYFGCADPGASWPPDTAMREPCTLMERYGGTQFGGVIPYPGGSA